MKNKILFVINSFEKEETEKFLSKTIKKFSDKVNIRTVIVDLTKQGRLYEDKVLNAIEKQNSSAVISLGVEVSSKFLKNKFETFRFQLQEKNFRKENISYDLYCGRGYTYYNNRSNLDTLKTHISGIVRKYT